MLAAGEAVEDRHAACGPCTTPCGRSRGRQILLGSGTALFADLVGGGPLALELVRTVASPHVTHLSYRVAR